MDFLNLEELEDRARAVMPQMYFDYYSGASDSQQSARDNLAIWKSYRLLPRILVDVSKLDLTTTFMGHKMAFPVMVAPSAMHGLAHPDKEMATARAAANAGIPMVVSTMATSSIDEVAASGHPCLAFQLYVIRDHSIVEQWVRGAEAAGCKAVMITVDAPRLGKREADERNKFCLPEGLELANLAVLQERAQQLHDSESEALVQARDTTQGSGLFQLFAKQVDDSLTWQFISWLKTITTLPIWIKGVLAPEDAALAVQHGVDGIVVSNHGGRQLDFAPSALQMLPEIARAVGGRIPVWVDGGVRRGTDILKALAMGASGVLVGRPVLYALALGGQEGVERALQLLKDEFELAMALSGCVSVAAVGPHMLLPAPGTTLPAALRS